MQLILKFWDIRQHLHVTIELVCCRFSNYYFFYQTCPDVRCFLIVYFYSGQATDGLQDFWPSVVIHFYLCQVLFKVCYIYMIPSQLFMHICLTCVHLLPISCFVHFRHQTLQTLSWTHGHDIVIINYHAGEHNQCVCLFAVGYYYFFSKQVRRGIVYGDQPRNRQDMSLVYFFVFRAISIL